MTIVDVPRQYKTILMDPPWQENGGSPLPGGAWGEGKRGADRHYTTVPTKEMPGIILNSGVWNPYRNSHLWVWATDTFLADGLWLMSQLGARYVTNAVWIKTSDPEDVLADHVNETINGLVLAEMRRKLALQIGLGQYMRGTKEILLFGVIGSGQAAETWHGHRNIPDTIRARRTKHSRKPDASYQLIEDISKGPRIEFFATQRREGWDSWGKSLPPPEDPNDPAE